MAKPHRPFFYEQLINHTRDINSNRCLYHRCDIQITNKEFTEMAWLLRAKQRGGIWPSVWLQLKKTVAVLFPVTNYLTFTSYSKTVF